MVHFLLMIASLAVMSRTALSQTVEVKSYPDYSDKTELENDDAITNEYSNHYRYFLEIGELTTDRTCHNYQIEVTPKWFTDWAFDVELFGPHLTKIRYIKATPVDDYFKPKGMVKVLLGGIGHNFALVNFKAIQPNESFQFQVNVCW